MSSSNSSASASSAAAAPPVSVWDAILRQFESKYNTNNNTNANANAAANQAIASIEDRGAGGHCGYYCIAAALFGEADDIIQMGMHALREIVAQVIGNDLLLAQINVPGMNVKDIQDDMCKFYGYPNWKSYCEHVHHTNQYIGDLELQVIADLFRVCIHIHHEKQTDLHIIKPNPENPQIKIEKIFKQNIPGLKAASKENHIHLGLDLGCAHYRHVIIHPFAAVVPLEATAFDEFKALLEQQKEFDRLPSGLMVFLDTAGNNQQLKFDDVKGSMKAIMPWAFIDDDQPSVLPAASNVASKPLSAVDQVFSSVSLQSFIADMDSVHTKVKARLMEEHRLGEQKVKADAKKKRALQKDKDTDKKEKTKESKEENEDQNSLDTDWRAIRLDRLFSVIKEGEKDIRRLQSSFHAALIGGNNHGKSFILESIACSTSDVDPVSKEEIIRPGYSVDVLSKADTQSVTKHPLRLSYAASKWKPRLLWLTKAQMKQFGYSEEADDGEGDTFDSAMHVEEKDWPEKCFGEFDQFKDAIEAVYKYFNYDMKAPTEELKRLWYIHIEGPAVALKALASDGCSFDIWDLPGTPDHVNDLFVSIRIRALIHSFKMDAFISVIGSRGGELPGFAGALVMAQDALVQPKHSMPQWMMLFNAKEEFVNTFINDTARIKSQTLDWWSAMKEKETNDFKTDIESVVRFLSGKEAFIKLPALTTAERQSLLSIFQSAGRRTSMLSSYSFVSRKNEDQHINDRQSPVYQFNGLIQEWKRLIKIKEHFLVCEVMNRGYVYLNWVRTLLISNNTMLLTKRFRQPSPKFKQMCKHFAQTIDNQFRDYSKKAIRNLFVAVAVYSSNIDQEMEDEGWPNLIEQFANIRIDSENQTTNAAFQSFVHNELLKDGFDFSQLFVTDRTGKESVNSEFVGRMVDYIRRVFNDVGERLLSAQILHQLSKPLFNVNYQCSDVELRFLRIAKHLDKPMKRAKLIQQGMKNKLDRIEIDNPSSWMDVLLGDDNNSTGSSDYALAQLKSFFLQENHQQLIDSAVVKQYRFQTDQHLRTAQPRSFLTKLECGNIRSRIEEGVLKEKNKLQLAIAVNNMDEIIGILATIISKPNIVDIGVKNKSISSIVNPSTFNGLLMKRLYITVGKFKEKNKENEFQKERIKLEDQVNAFFSKRSELALTSAFNHEYGSNNPISDGFIQPKLYEPSNKEKEEMEKNLEEQQKKYAEANRRDNEKFMKLKARNLRIRYSKHFSQHQRDKLRLPEVSESQVQRNCIVESFFDRISVDEKQVLSNTTTNAPRPAGFDRPLSELELRVDCKVNEKESCKIIRLSDDPHHKQNHQQTFELTLYPTLLADLAQLLQCIPLTSTDMLIPSNPFALYPIFIPSKGRSSQRVNEENTKERYPEANLLDTDQFLAINCGSPLLNREFNYQSWQHLVFVVVEEQELDEYRRSFANASMADRLVFVSIPGKDRMIGFSRSCIIIIQQVLRQLCRLAGFDWPFYWMIDDDVVDCDLHAKNSVGGYLKCGFFYGLLFAQAALLSEIEKSDARPNLFIDPEGDELGEFRKWLQDLKNALAVPRFLGQNSLIKIEEAFKDNYEKNKKDLLMWHSRGNLQSKVKEFYKPLVDKCIPADPAAAASISMSITNSNIDQRKQKLNTLMAIIDGCAKKLDNLLTMARCNGSNRCAQLALALQTSKRKGGHSPEADYNLLDPSATHRFSDQRHACVLYNAEAVKGMAFLPPSRPADSPYTYLFAPLSRAQKILAESSPTGNATNAEKNSINGFLNGDKLFIELLRKNGRGGFILFNFRIRKGDQPDGGVQDFRRGKYQMKAQEAAMQVEEPDDDEIINDWDVEENEEEAQPEENKMDVEEKVDEGGVVDDKNNDDNKRKRQKTTDPNNDAMDDG